MQPPKRTFSLRGPAGSRSTRAAAAEGATVDEVSAVSRADAEGCFRFRDLLEGMSGVAKRWEEARKQGLEGGLLSFVKRVAERSGFHALAKIFIYT